MRYPKMILSVLAVLCYAGAAAAADKYNIDTTHSGVEFSVTHMMVSKVKGKFTDFTGTIMLDPNDMTKSSVEVTIQTASVDTENERRNNHLRSADFFDVENHPTITFKSSRVEKTGDGYVAHGTLTMRGVSKQIELPFTIAGPVKIGNNSRIGVAANLMINRQDYGVSWNRVLDVGGVTVSDEVAIELNVEAVSG